MDCSKSKQGATGMVAWATVLMAAMAFASPARAAFHLWSIQEIYSNSSGSLQFIELTDAPPFDTSGGFQNFVNGMTISVSNPGGTLTNSFTIPGNPLPGNTLDHTLLFGTSGVQAAGGPAPDYIIPDNFLFTGGGSIGFFGANSGPYGPMPTDGLLSLNFTNGTTSLNTPMNFSGQTGTVIGVPEPSTLVLTPLAMAVGGLRRWLSRRRVARSRPATA
jgi:hypothetical protein